MDVLKRNHVKVFGKGQQAMVFSHGFGCDQNMWRFITPAFLTKYKIVLFDHVGAGSSDVSAYDKEKYSTLHGYAEDILQIYRELDITDSVFVGHSVGAMMGVLSSIKEPERFKKLILIGPSPCYINDEKYTGGFEYADIQSMLTFMETDYVGWAFAFAPIIMGNSNEPSLGEELAMSFCNTDFEIARHFAQVTFLSDNRLDLPLLTTHSLIMQCAEDTIAPSEVGEYLHHTIRNSTLVHLKAKGHCPNLSAPMETIETMEWYLTQSKCA
ncbi:alpha/beta fold hydrolase [Pontibacter sp. 13R65]